MITPSSSRSMAALPAAPPAETTAAAPHPGSPQPADTSDLLAPPGGPEADVGSSSAADPVVSRKSSGTTANSHSTVSTTGSALPSMRWVKTLQKLTAAKAGQAKQFAEARREHTKTHDSAHPPDCGLCTDFVTRGDALMAELRAMDATLREMEDAVVDELREYKAVRRRERRDRERKAKRAEERAGAAKGKGREVRESVAAAV